MAAGQTFLVAKARAFWGTAFDTAASTTKWPSLNAPYNDQAAWASAGFAPILDTVNGVGLTFRNPRVAVNSEERGRLGQVAGGDEGITVGLQLVTFPATLLAKISALITKTQTSTAHVADLALTTGVTTNGTFTITLNGTTYTVAGATSTAQGTAANLATYLSTGTNYSPVLTGWTPTVVSSTTVRYTATAAGARGGTYALAPAATGVTGTFTASTVGYDTIDLMHLDKNADMSFAIGIDGVAPAGTLYTERRYIRFIGYHVENTANTEHRLANTALDAVMRPNMTLECQPAVSIPSAATTGTGVNPANLDDNKRADYAFISAPEV